MKYQMRDHARKPYRNGWLGRYALTLTLRLLTNAQVGLDRCAGACAIVLQRARQGIVRLLCR